MFIKHTKSLCSECYREVVATVGIVGSEVQIRKACPEHGEQVGVLEVDPNFYLDVQAKANPIYAGHFVDVTTRCNLQCAYCFFPCGEADTAFDAIWAECAMNRGPYLITGGEPTIRQDLPEVLAGIAPLGPIQLATNGFGLLDRQFLLECTKSISTRDEYLNIALSIHSEAAYLPEVIENFRGFGIKLDTAMLVIDRLAQIDEVIAFARAHRELFSCFRVKVATNVWNEGKAGKLFNSQILKAFEAHGPVILLAGAKAVYAPFLFDGMCFAAVAWHDVDNIDLCDIATPPTYRAKTGEVCDFVKALAINKGVDLGWLAGRRI